MQWSQSTNGQWFPVLGMRLHVFFPLIDNFHRDHYAPRPPPPQILHNHCFQFPLGITVVQREVEDNGYAKILGR